MSNFSMVMVCWSACDWAAKQEGHARRAQRLFDAIREDCAGRAQLLSMNGADDKPRGGACEVVIVISANHFYPHCENGNGDRTYPDWMKLLCGMAWEMPADVCILWKAEEDETYQTFRPLVREVFTGPAPLEPA